MEVTRLFDLLPYSREKYPDLKVALAAKQGQQWRTYSPEEYIDLVQNTSYGLIQIGLKPGDKVALISGNRPEWNVVDMAVMQAGGIPVPIYPTITESDYRYILSHAGVRFLFMEDKSILRKIKNILQEMPEIAGVYSFDPCEGYPVLKTLTDQGRSNPSPEILEQRKSAVKPDDISCLMYTSGTTGFPKGVMHTHRSVLSNIMGVEKTPTAACKVAFSFLPLCHAYEKMLVYLYQYKGMSIYYAQSLGTLVENLKEVKPNIMGAVPRIFEKIYDKLYISGKHLPPFQQKIYYWAFELAKQYKIEGNGWIFRMKLALADYLVYKKWRKAVGGDNFEIFISGAAALKPFLAAFFSGIGMPVFEGYGMTEASPIIAVHHDKKFGRRIGTVGQPMPGVEVKIAPDGEIICRGDNLMAGYYKDEALTKEVFDEEGWFHTGDLGKFVEYGHLVITGRKKSLFKTSFGKYVNPEGLENKFSESPLIEQIVVFGESQKFPAALILPDFTILKNWCTEQNIPFTTPEMIVQHKEVRARYQQEVNHYNEFFGEVEKIKKFALIPDEWSQDTGIITPTLKVKRNVVADRYKEVINTLFS